MVCWEGTLLLGHGLASIGQSSRLMVADGTDGTIPPMFAWV